MSKNIAYDDAVGFLFERFPEFRRRVAGEYGEKLDDIGSLPHAVFGELTRFVVDLLTSGTSSDLRDAFALIEDMSQSADERTRNLVQVSFLENLQKDPEAYKKAHRLMGADTKSLSGEVEAFWEGKPVERRSR